MIQLSFASLEILSQLKSVVGEISTEDFRQPIPILSGSTIGQHVRHTLEFFLCLESGIDRGVINYDKRGHDKQIETDKAQAVLTIDHVCDRISMKTNDKALRLEVGYELHSDSFLTITTNYYRELAYNIEHATHHMAIIKIGIKAVAPYVNLPVHFGVAASTVRYQEYSSSPLQARAN